MNKKQHMQTTFLCDLATVPEALMPWLTDAGSLTKKFEILAGQPLKVVQTDEGFQPVGHAYRQALKLARKQNAWVRQVQLFGNDQVAWATAKSIFPISCLNGRARRLRYLGSTPLGYVLFARHQPCCQRVIKKQTDQNQAFFIRENYYHWHGRTILVEETFLPEFIKKILVD